MTPQVLKLFALGVICGLLLTPLMLDVFNLKRGHTDTDTHVRTGEFPTGTPANSAPPMALSACTNKSFGESCTFGSGSSTVTGLCSWSGDALACGPSLPTQSIQ